MSISSLHRWVGLSLCAFVLLITATGTLLIWKPEYLWLSIADARQVVDRDNKSLALAIERIQASYGVGEVRFIQLHSEGLALHKVFLTSQRYAWHSQQGKQLQVWKGNERWENWLLDLHHRFLLGNRFGLNVVGFTGLLLLPLSIIGLTVWWPRRRLLKLGVRPVGSEHGAWMISHSNLGALSLLPVLLLAFTGTVLVYPSESRWLLVGGFSAPLPPIRTSQSSAVELNWPSVLDYVHRRYPDSTLRWLSPLTSDVKDLEPTVIKVGLQQADEWNSSGSTSIRFMESRLEIQNGLGQPWLKRGVDFTYPLHTGKLGMVYRVMLTLFGLMIMAVSILGFGSFVKRYRQ